MILVRQAINTCRVRCRNTKGEIYEIAVFTRVLDDFQFTRDGDDFRNKVPIGELEVCIALRIA
jgi:hypothetical protein